MTPSRINWLKEEVDTAVNVLVTLKNTDNCEFVLFQTEHTIEPHPIKTGVFVGKYGMHIIPGSCWLISVVRSDATSFIGITVKRDNSKVVAILPEEATPYDHRFYPYGMAQDIIEYMPKIPMNVVKYWVEQTLTLINSKSV